MQNKLQELTDKLYQEGLSKGKEEADALLARSREQADKIIADANVKAEEIIAQARRDAEALRTKVEGDIKMASSQVLQATRRDVENLVIAKVSDEKVGAAMSDGAFLKKVITEVASKFSAQQACDIALVLPESLHAELEPFVKGELAKTLSKGVSASFTKKIAGGFTIGPADGSYFISFTDESFKALIGEYLRPVTKKLLFG